MRAAEAISDEIVSIREERDRLERESVDLYLGRREFERANPDHPLVVALRASEIALACAVFGESIMDKVRARRARRAEIDSLERSLLDEFEEMTGRRWPQGIDGW